MHPASHSFILSFYFLLLSVPFESYTRHARCVVTIYPWYYYFMQFCLDLLGELVNLIKLFAGNLGEGKEGKSLFTLARGPDPNLRHWKQYSPVLQSSSLPSLSPVLHLPPSTHQVTSSIHVNIHKPSSQLNINILESQNQTTNQP